MAMVTTMANSLKILPTTPPISSTGRNTATRDAVIEMMVKPISRLPCSAASMGFIPSSICRTMFSSMTMASSTTSPTASVRPSSEILSIENPRTYMTPKVTTSEVGTASVGIRVAATRLRNMKITRTTSPMVMASVTSTSFTAAWIEVERSLRMLRRADGPRSCRNFGIIDLTRLATSTVLAPGCRNTAMTSEGLPS